MTRQFADYRIVRGDTLESIALAALGRTSQWRLLATLNRLRYPFISDDAIAQYGSPLLTAALTANLAAGTDAFTAPLPASTAIWEKGNVFYIQKTNGDGTVSHDAMVLATDVDTLTGAVTFTADTVFAYQDGTAYSVFIKPRELSTSVLRTGDVLHIPSTGGGTVIAAGSEDFLDLLGVDVAMGMDGQIVLSADGDVSTVSGTENLKQALRNRLNTPVAALPYDPEYGNQCFDHLGEMISPYFLNLVSALVGRAIVGDPRISQVSNVEVVQRGTQLDVSASLLVAPSSQLLRLNNVVLRLA